MSPVVLIGPLGFCRAVFRIALTGLALAAVCACSNVCLTVYDQCRAPLDTFYPAAPVVDGGVAVVDSGTDASFSACVKPACQDACAGLDDFRLDFVCLFHECVSCQRGDGGSAVFCARVYSCGYSDGSVPDAAPQPDGGPWDGGVSLDAATMGG
jgi:hypothetical protein